MVGSVTMVGLMQARSPRDQMRIKWDVGGTGAVDGYEDEATGVRATRPKDSHRDAQEERKEERRKRRALPQWHSI
jgi:hypothetical protein